MIRQKRAGSKKIWKRKSRCHRFHILGGAMKILVDFHPGDGVTVPKFQMQII